ncbi:hypothetical protein BV25DRAFT_1800806, partial [Artomyces pyxidatus]
HVSDLPASRKLQGLASFTSKEFMCPHDKMKFYMLVDPACFNPQTFEKRNDWKYLKYAYRSQATDDPALQDAIFEKRGVRWSVMDKLPNWFPAQSGVIDFMHSMFLGITKHVIRNILYSAGMFNGSSSRAEHQPLTRLTEFFDAVWWPPSIGRLPSNLVKSGAGKADQWRTLISIFFVGVFVAWQKLEATVEEPTEADYARIRETSPSRNLPSHYDTLLQYTAAVRILATQSTTPFDVTRGMRHLGESFQSWAWIGCHLTPYCHLAMHFEPQFLRLGPSAYVTAAWAYERDNGVLARINHNGHAGGELEAMQMRRWWKKILMINLVRMFITTGVLYR